MRTHRWWSSFETLKLCGLLVPHAQMYGAIVAGVQLWTMLFCQNPSQNVLGSKIFYIILTKFDYVYMQLYIKKCAT